MKSLAYYLSVFMLIGCLCQGCSGDDITVSQSNGVDRVSMQDVLQKFLDAGFQVDSTAVGGDDTFDSPEEALAFLESYKKEKERRLSSVTRADDGTKIYDLKVQLINEGDTKIHCWLGTFTVDNVKVSIVTPHQGGGSPFSVDAAFVGTGAPFTEYEGSTVFVEDISAYVRYIPFYHITFRLVKRVCAKVVIGGMTVVERCTDTQAACDVNYEDRTVRYRPL